MHCSARGAAEKIKKFRGPVSVPEKNEIDGKEIDISPLIKKLFPPRTRISGVRITAVTRADSSTTSIPNTLQRRRLRSPTPTAADIGR